MLQAFCILIFQFANSKPYSDIFANFDYKKFKKKNKKKYSF